MNEYEKLTNQLRMEMPFDELLAGLAEEADELGQAALKYRRAVNRINPTPVTLEQAREELLTEFADVMLYCNLLDFPKDSEWAAVSAIMAEKAKRFLNRLEERNAKKD